MAGRRKSAEAVKRQPLAAVAARSSPKRNEPQAGVGVALGHKGRRTGKRSDPAFRPTTVFVRKETQRKATRLLEDQDAGKDFSDLVEELVADWITEHSHA
jgi:hypothetical protein